MTYLHKLPTDNGFVKYEYGPQKGMYIGTINLQVNVSANVPFRERKIDLAYYNGNSFCQLTSAALQGIAKFVREGIFPEDYLRATY